jgi:hypothetical protein
MHLGKMRWNRRTGALFMRRQRWSFGCNTYHFTSGSAVAVTLAGPLGLVGPLAGSFGDDK